jgi:hypothetical protein
MTSRITFEQAAKAFNDLTTEELIQLFRVKILEATNAHDFIFERSEYRNPLKNERCKENLRILNEIFHAKSTSFFGYEVDLSTTNLQIVIQFMAEEFHKSRAKGENQYSDEFWDLEEAICKKGVEMTPDCVAELHEKAGQRFAEIAFFATLRKMSKYLMPKTIVLVIEL